MRGCRKGDNALPRNMQGRQKRSKESMRERRETISPCGAPAQNPAGGKVLRLDFMSIRGYQLLLAVNR